MASLVSVPVFQPRLRAFTASLSSALTPEEVKDVILRQGMAALGAAAGSLALLVPDGKLEIAASIGYPREATERYARVPLGDPFPLAVAAREGTAVLLRDPEERRERYPEFARASSLPHRAWAAVPLLVEGKPIGAIGLSYAEPREFLMEERAALAAVADHCAQALERARLYDALAKSEARYRSLVEMSPEPIAVHLDGVLQYANPAAVRLVGARSAAEVVGRSIMDFVHADSRASVVERMRTMRATRAPVPVTEERFVRLDGTPVDCEVVAIPIDYEGKPAVQVVIRDITFRRRAQEELAMARRQVAVSERLSALGTLVAGVAHEIRTPLAYLNNHVFLLRSRVERGAKEGASAAALLADLEPHTEATFDAVERISRLVRELGRFTRSAELNAAGERREVLLADVVAQASHLFGSTHPARVDVRVRVVGEPRARADHVHLQQVVLNLLENAADAMPKGGVVDVLAEERDGKAVLAVTDAGEGIPEDVQLRMFDPFFTTKQHGTGLGLAIVRRIVEQHGGRIAFTTSPGGPTTFTVELPCG